MPRMWKTTITLVALEAARLVACQSIGYDSREATIETVHHDLYSGLTSCRAVVSSFISRIQTFNDRVNAIITLNPNALATADAMDQALAAGNATGPLFCIPILLKDNYDTADMNTTGGCLDLQGSQPSVDAPTVAALRQAGAIVFGKSNLHELALEGLSVSSYGGQTINPYDSTRTPGGSSGGTGAGVASSFCVWGTGTDTVNSLRSPASANSLFSIRPTRGLITRTGVIPISYTQDALGAIGRTIKDIAVALTVMASTGYDPSDNATALIPESSVGVDYSADIGTGSLKGVRLGLINGFFNFTASNETTPVVTAMNKMVKKLQSAGAVVVPINDTFYNSTTIGNFDVQRFEYREDLDNYLQQSILKGVHPSSFNELYSSGKYLVIPSQYSYVNTAAVSSTSNVTYDTVQAGIRNLTLYLQETFVTNNLTAIIYPEQANLVVKIGAPSQSGRNGILGALTGSPVVTVPAGFSPPTADAPIGVPIGMEILGRPFTEAQLLSLGYEVELLTKIRKPPVFARTFVEVQNYSSVPVIKPDSGNISPNYPIGVL